jgi:hypothetical protein
MQIYNNDVILRPGMVLVLELRFNLVSHAPVKYVPVKQKTGKFNRINSASHYREFHWAPIAGFALRFNRQRRQAAKILSATPVPSAGMSRRFHGELRGRQTHTDRHRPRLNGLRI